MLLTTAPRSFFVQLTFLLPHSNTRSCQVAKQMKMVPFPNYEPDADVAMSESPSSDAVSFFPENNHTRLHSTASSSSSSSLYSDGIDLNSRTYT
jgi:hypothetical protein